METDDISLLEKYGVHACKGITGHFLGPKSKRICLSGANLAGENRLLLSTADASQRDGTTKTHAL